MRQIQQQQSLGPILPAYGTPIPKELVGQPQYYNTYHNTVNVNGMPAANNTVDAQQITQHAANIATNDIAQRLAYNGVMG